MLALQYTTRPKTKMTGHSQGQLVGHSQDQLFLTQKFEIEILKPFQQVYLQLGFTVE